MHRYNQFPFSAKQFDSLYGIGMSARYMIPLIVSLSGWEFTSNVSHAKLKTILPTEYEKHITLFSALLVYVFKI